MMALVRHLGMVRVRVVDGVVFTLADIADKGLAMVMIGFRIIRLPIVFNKVIKIRIRAGSVVGAGQRGQGYLRLCPRGSPRHGGPSREAPPGGRQF